MANNNIIHMNERWKHSNKVVSENEGKGREMKEKAKLKQNLHKHFRTEAQKLVQQDRPSN